MPKSSSWIWFFGVVENYLEINGVLFYFPSYVFLWSQGNVFRWGKWACSYIWVCQHTYVICTACPYRNMHAHLPFSRFFENLLWFGLIESWVDQNQIRNNTTNFSGKYKHFNPLTANQSYYLMHFFLDLVMAIISFLILQPNQR